jgi:ribonuclease VapC
MIVVDTSAIMAILQKEAAASACMTAIREADTILMSAGTTAELLIVAGRRGIAEMADRFVCDLGVEVATVTARTARQVADAYERWGKGVHPAGLNLGDCFAYALAKERACPLLFVGDDFSRTDVMAALS